MDWQFLIVLIVVLTLGEVSFRLLFYPKLLKKARNQLLIELGEMVEANDEVTVTIVRNPKKKA